jgi:DNA invertase Pin-like site-specific DNA recombinase
MIKYLIDLPLLLLYAAALAGWLHRVIPQGGVNVAANGDDMTETTDPMKVAMRQIAGAFAQLEKARLVAKLKAARERKREANGKREGRKSYAEGMPETVALAKDLHGRRSVLTAQEMEIRIHGDQH